MGIFRKRGRPLPSRRITSIRRSVLETICETSINIHPNEFAGVLKASGDTIEGLMLMPGAISGQSHAIFRTHNLPGDLSIVGTVHSHPSPYAIPSDADLQLFRGFGRVHIIIASPYNLHSWKAYGNSGREKTLEMLDL